MSFIKRALLYLWRKKVRTVVMALIFLLIFTFVLVGEGLERAVSKASQHVEAGTSSYFMVDYRPEAISTGGNFVDPLTLNDVEKLKGIKGISDLIVNSQVAGEIKNVEAVPVDGYTDWNYFKFRMTSNSEKHVLFRTDSIKLKEGRNIQANDKQVALISEEIAEKNQLKLGDFLELNVEPDSAQLMGLDQSQTSKCQIIGIFKTLYKTSSRQVLAEELIENQVFVDLETGRTLEQVDTINDLEIDNVYCYVKNPNEINEIMTEVEEKIDTSRFRTVVNDKTYQKIQAPMDSLQELSKSMIRNIVVIAVVILSLLWFLWSKSRVREMGILIAAGKTKWNIISQLMLEVVIIVIVAIGLSYFVSSQFGSVISNYFIAETNQTLQDTETNLVNDETLGQQLEASNVSNTLSDDEVIVEVKRNDLLKLVPISLLITLIIVPVGSISILRLRPNKILSTME